MDLMVDTVNKNGHKSYVLMEGGKRSSAYRHAFAKYSFPYQDEIVRDIVRDIRPDAVLYMGAQDTCFSWREKQSGELSRYTACVANVVSAYASFSDGRFIYLSSGEVYENLNTVYENGLDEGAAPAPDSTRAMAILQGEGICENCRRTMGKDVVVLRLDNLYGLPRKGQREGDVCFRGCLEALKTGTVSGGTGDVFSMLHAKDAAAFIYAVMTAESHQHSVYQLSSARELSGLELARIISEEAGFPVTAREREGGENRRRLLNADRFTGEFGMKATAVLREEVREILWFMNREKRSYLEDEDPGGGGWNRLAAVLRAVLPFAENLVCCGIFGFLSSQVAGSRYFGKLDFFLLYVLLFAIMHGQQQAILSALLGTLGYFYLQASKLGGFEALLDYNTYVWTAQLFVVGMAVGITRDRMHQIREEQREEIRFLKNRIKNLEEINDSNVRMKQGFESELVNQRESLARMYELTSRLEKYAPEEVLFYAAEVLEELMGSRDVSIYLVANRGYARLFSSTSVRARQLGNSYAYASPGEFYETLKDRRVFINRKMDTALPMMASAVFVDNEMQFIFMVWEIPWQRMNLAEANRLMIAGALIQDSVVRSRRYLEALRDTRYLEGTNTLRTEAFRTLVNAFMDARDRDLTEYVLLEVLIEKERYEKADQELGKSLRQTDYMGILGDGKLCVLLANTNEEHAEDVMKRFRGIGYETRLRRVR